MSDNRRLPLVEWRTLSLMLGCTLAIALLVGNAAGAALWLAIPALGALLALHSSLQHEALHGHPFRQALANELLVCVPFGWWVPYRRFRDLHLVHHTDERLTDPYDDPESNYLHPAVWARLPGWSRALLGVNNTLAGRMVLGPFIAIAHFLRGELRRAAGGEVRVIRGWLMHLVPLAALLVCTERFAAMPLWAYALATYLGLSLLRIRTFLEHRAHDDVDGRTAVVEDRGWLAFVFLNNNLHSVHHRHPMAPWYRLPALHRAHRARWSDRNDGYVYASYRHVFGAYLFRAKDPVSHPLRSPVPPPR